MVYLAVMTETALVELAEVPWGSARQRESVDLRRRVLREPLGLEFSREELEAECDDHHLVAVEAGRVTAVMVLRPLGNGTVKMRQVAVEPGRQRAGLGTALVAFAESFCREKGYRLITLHARDTAVAFYLRLGYAVYGNAFTEVGIPHRYMKKSLS